jgi:hypothetical protein
MPVEKPSFAYFGYFSTTSAVSRPALVPLHGFAEGV